MEKKTIGSFIAALRKSRGMTQQEVAERLNVSNKTVSKWERDESYPEITLIPVIAEIFEVTSDEILRGERITKEETAADKSDMKTEKQIKRILNRDLTKFKNISMIAFAIILVGLIFLFTICYAFYKPVIGFGVFLIFIIASVLLEGIQLNLTNASLLNNELLSEEGNILAALRNKKYKYAIQVFNMDVTAVIFALPFIMYSSPYYTDSVITWDSYITLVPVLFVFSVISYFISKQIYRSITGSSVLGEAPEITLQKKRLLQMNIIQICLIAISCINMILAKGGLSNNRFYIGGLLLPVFVFMISILVFLFLCKGVKIKMFLLLASIRNFICGLMGIYLIMGILIWINGNTFTPLIPFFYMLFLLSIITIAIYAFLWKLGYEKKEKIFHGEADKG